MNDLRAKYLWQVGHYVSGHADNIRNVDETFLRELEERAGIQEKGVATWRRIVYNELLDGHTTLLDKSMGYILGGVGEVT